MRRPRLAHTILIVVLSVGILAGVVLQHRALADPARAPAAPVQAQAVAVVTGDADGAPAVHQRDAGVRLHGTVATQATASRPADAAADQVLRAATGPQR